MSVDIEYDDVFVRIPPVKEYFVYVKIGNIEAAKPWRI